MEGDERWHPDRYDRIGSNNFNPGHNIDSYVWDVSQSSDQTIHLNLNLVDDFGPDLDEFLRLTRFGHFYAAKDFFHENLEEQSENPYVFVLYAQMLLDSADYAAVMALKVPRLLSVTEESILQDYWTLIHIVAQSHVTGVSKKDAESVVTAAMNSVRRVKQYGSTEVIIVSQLLSSTELC